MADLEAALIAARTELKVWEALVKERGEQATLARLRHDEAIRSHERWVRTVRDFDNALIQPEPDDSGGAS